MREDIVTIVHIFLLTFINDKEMTLLKAHFEKSPNGQIEKGWSAAIEWKADPKERTASRAEMR